ncbi:MAG: hypothetical protein E7478_08005 [Ruminococcaceae bacterium]|nr:hypothetical protein [Oscillospiraceae bacterium]
MKKTVLYYIIIAAAVLCTGCSNDTGAPSQAATEVTTAATTAVTEASTTAQTTTQQTVASTSATEQTTTAEEAVPQPPAESKMSFEPGVWTIKVGGVPKGYYITDADALSGRTLEFETGTGIGFEYIIGVNEVWFSFGEADNYTLYPVLGGDPSIVFLELPDGTEMEMRYESDMDPEALDFYSNMQLCELALQYYTAQTGYTPSSAAAETNEDGTVTIQLYDNLGDHNSTAAWYTVDRFTATGTDDTAGCDVALLS